MSTQLTTRIAIMALFVLTIGCASPAADESAQSLASEVEPEPTVEATPDPTPEPTAEPTLEPTATAEVVQNCMDPDVYARLTDQTLSSTPASPQEAIELGSALRAYDFTDLSDSLRSYIGRQIQSLEEFGTLSPEFIITMLAGEISITTCGS